MRGHYGRSEVEQACIWGDHEGMFSGSYCLHGVRGRSGLHCVREKS